MVDSTPLIAEARPQGKMGHRVLCCCDSRKATIFISIGALAMTITSLVLMAVPGSGVENTGWDSIIIPSIDIVFYLLVIWGAIRFHRCAVTICLIWEIIALILICVSAGLLDWSSIATEQEKYAAIWLIGVSIAWKTFVIYAMGTFVSEVSSGIMSHETIDREKYSCCCNV
jgi:hypothetical protein